MEFNLTMMERFAISEILPKKSDFVMVKQFRELKELMSLKPEEIKRYEVKYEEGGKISWNRSLDEGMDFEISEVQVDIIKDELRKLNDKKQLEDKHFTLYKKFVGG